MYNKKDNFNPTIRLEEESHESIFSKSISHGASGGRKNSLAVSVIFGNKITKTLGLGYADSPKLKEAMEKALFNAKKHNVTYSNLEKLTTLPFELRFKLRGNSFCFKPSKEGFVSHKIVKQMLSIIGLKSISCKIYGSRHPRIISLGVVEALKQSNFLLNHFDNIKKYAKEKNKSNE